MLISADPCGSSSTSSSVGWLHFKRTPASPATTLGRDDSSTLVDIGLVGQEGVPPRSGLHGDFETGVHHLADRFRYRGDAPLPFLRLSDDNDVHAGQSSGCGGVGAPGRRS